MSVTLQRSLSIAARSFHTTSPAQVKILTALELPRYLGQNRIKEILYGVNTNAGPCIFKNALNGRIRIITSTYYGKASPPIYQLRAAFSDSDPKHRALIFKDRRATYVYPTPLHFSPHEETPALVKKVTFVVVECGRKNDLEFSETQAPQLPLPFLEEIQRLIEKTR